MPSCGRSCRRSLNDRDPDCGQCGALRGDNPPPPGYPSENEYDDGWRLLGFADALT